MQAISPRNNSTRVLMLPWLAHGHISPYLELAKRLIKTFPKDQTLHIYFCSTLANLASIKAKTLANPSLSGSVEFVELSLPELPELPRRRHTTNGLPPSLMPSLKTASDMSANPSFAKILEETEPDLVVFDFAQPWAPALAAERGVPAVLFMSFGAATTAFILHFAERRAEKFPFAEIFLREFEVGGLERLLGAAANGLSDRERLRLGCERSSNVVLLKTFAEIEGKYIDYLSALLGKRIVPVGPLVGDDDDDDDGDSDDQVMKWLNQKERSSVVFVSFGSEYFLSEHDIAEIARGLELTSLSFIWVIRFPTGRQTTLQEATPAGNFLNRVGPEKGLVVEWAPQRAVLRSGRAGAFVSHCGWSSMMESMRFGVPMVGVPMHLDQPLNARLVEEIGVGLEVEREAGSGRVAGEAVAAAVRWVVVERGGEGVRGAAAAAMEMMRRKGDEEMEEVVKELLEITGKAKRQFNV